MNDNKGVAEAIGRMVLGDEYEPRQRSLKRKQTATTVLAAVVSLAVTLAFLAAIVLFIGFVVHKLQGWF